MNQQRSGYVGASVAYWTGGGARQRGDRVTVILNPDHCLAFTDSAGNAADAHGYSLNLTTVTMPEKARSTDRAVQRQ
jgi:hypothetical protein